MNNSLNKNLIFFLVVIVSATFLACSPRKTIVEQTYNYDELLDLNVTLKTKSLRHIEIQGNKNTFLYFDYIINNRSPKAVYFDPSLIRVKANNLTNYDTTFDSIASHMPEETRLETGEHKFNLYAIFKSYELDSPIKSMQITHAGLSMEAFSP